MEKECDSKLLRSLKDRDDFILTFELVPGPGGRTRHHSRILNLAKEIAADGRIRALSITENAGGHPALTPGSLGADIRAMGSEVIIHLSCKDKNRNQMESLLFGWDRLNLNNLLVVAGDYPKKGYQGHPKPVFDLDTVQALDLIGTMNRGLTANEKADPATELQATSFLKGVVVSPFKFLESELVMQYAKLHRKVAAGADFVITQIGYDARKFHELLLYMRQKQLDIPVLGNVFIPNLPVMELMHQGKIPGCVITETFLRQMRQEAQAADRGKEARLLRAAKLLAILKGLGYGGAHIGGQGLTFTDLDFVLNTAATMEQRWQTYTEDISFWPDESFWYFTKDSNTGLNTDQPTIRPDLHQGILPGYHLARFVHKQAFATDGLLYRPMKSMCLAFDKGRQDNILCRFEHTVKAAFFGCQNCGDCTLAELAFLCPQDGCAKYLLNGPCGGSRDGWCEVYPGSKKCLYVKIYERLKSSGIEKALKEGFVPPRDWALNNSSSWINFFSGRDHTRKNKKKG
jgi:methylenetetrahydrofolate reductase (NADPH)